MDFVYRVLNQALWTGEATVRCYVCWTQQEQLYGPNLSSLEITATKFSLIHSTVKSSLPTGIIILYWRFTEAYSVQGLGITSNQGEMSRTSRPVLSDL